MKTLGTSGTRNVSAINEARLTEYVADDAREWFGSFDRFVSGACRGWDAFFGELMVRLFPQKEHLVIVPANQSQVDKWWERYTHVDTITVIYMNPGTTYRDRNVAIVEESDYLFYCAEYVEAHALSRRSGTWQTVRIAKKRSVPTTGVVLHDS